MIKMGENILTIYDENDNVKDYKILLVIENDYKYIIYTDLNNYNIKKNLYAIKLNSLESNETLFINNSEWKMLEKEYNNLIK